jgi:hypothetical protein
MREFQEENRNYTKAADKSSKMSSTIFSDMKVIVTLTRPFLMNGRNSIVTAMA